MTYTNTPPTMSAAFFHAQQSVGQIMLTFGQATVTPSRDANAPSATEVIWLGTLALSPPVTKQLHQLLGMQLQMYESMHGPIPQDERVFGGTVLAEKPEGPLS